MLRAHTLPTHIARLGQVPIFSECNQRQLRQIDQLGTTVSVHAGYVLCQAGDVGRECFVLLDGRSDVVFRGRQTTVGRDALLGEIALLTPKGRRTATVTTTSDTKVLAFTRREFGRLVSTLPAVEYKVLQEAARRLIENVKVR